MEYTIILLFILVCILVAAAMAIEEEVVRACEAFSFDEELVLVLYRNA